MISGNGIDGIRIGSTYKGVKIYGNKIGTNLNATASIQNQSNGLRIESEFNFVGKAGSDIASNIISGNGFHGVFITTATAKYNKIYNNFIGTNASGANLGNLSDGVFISQADSNNIGDGTAAGGNRIAFNNFRAVVVSSGTQNEIRANSIYSNGAIGIDLGDDGLTTNDAIDADAGANNLQNFPVIHQASPAQISGTIKTQSLMLVKFDVFRVDACDVSGYGEGRYYVGSFEGETDLNNTLSFNITGFNLAVGQTIVMTATDDFNNTSEFSQCIAVTPQTNVSLSTAAYTANEAATARTIVVNRTGGTNTAVTVNYATDDGTAIAGQDYTATNGTLSFGIGEVVKTFDISITNDSTDEADETINRLEQSDRRSVFDRSKRRRFDNH